MKSLIKRLQRDRDQSLSSSSASCSAAFALPEVYISNSFGNDLEDTVANFPFPRCRMSLVDPNNHVRILHLLSSEANCEHEIRASISVARLDDVNIRYEALSYTWGAPIKSKRIYIDGYSFAVTENLYAALLRLRAQGHLQLWIDAICIDQDNNEERSIQVSRMSTVFQRAQQVLIWLGEDSEEEDGRWSMEFFKYFDWKLGEQWLVGNRSEAEKELEVHPNKERLRAWLSGLEFDEDHENFDHSLLCCEKGLPELPLTKDLLCTFFARPWFGRRWVYQEVFVTRSATMLCGEHVLSWSILMQALKIVPDWELGDREANVALSLSSHCIDWTAPYEPAKDPYELLLVLSDIARLQCEDDRDRVGAVLSLSPSSTYRVDYSASVSENYFQFAKSLVESGYLFHVLVCVCMQEKAFRVRTLDKLPSWVPDWRVKAPFRAYVRFIVKTHSAKVSERRSLVIENVEVVELSNRNIAAVRKVLRYAEPEAIDFLAQLDERHYCLLDPVESKPRIVARLKGFEWRLRSDFSDWKHLDWKKRTIEII